ncbi:MAG: hypothetical protein ABFC56_07070 [Clostridiaceae bacterium]
MPNHDGTGPAKGCCQKGEHTEGGCGCENKQQHQADKGGQCCQNGEKHRHHGEHHDGEGGCCHKQKETE